MPRLSSPMASFCRCRFCRPRSSAASICMLRCLPRWRGAAPINRAIMAGDRETGVTVMKMDEGLDTGAIAMTERVPIGADMTAGELHDVLAERGADLMARALAALERGTLQFTAAAGGRCHLRRENRQGRDAHRLDQALAKRARSYSRSLAVSRRLVRNAGRGPRQAAAHDQGRGFRRARAPCSTIVSLSHAAKARCAFCNCSAPASSR